MTQAIQAQDWLLIHVTGQLYRKPLRLPEQIIPPLWNDILASGCTHWQPQKWLTRLQLLLRSPQGIAPLYQQLVQHRRRLHSQETIAQITWEHLRACIQSGARMCFQGSHEYPPLLNHISDPPTALTVWGHTHFPTQPHVAIVGSRKALPEATEMSFALGRTFAKQGWVCVSGGAYGCDIAAHQGCLSTENAGEHTMVVFAGGLGHLSPTGNQHVFQEILAVGGCLLSEQVWTHRPTRYDFPRRNRILTGICSEVVLVQAAHKSGTGITAQLALEEGREVLVYLPAHDLGPAFAANQQLRHEGAPHFASIADFHNCYPWSSSHQRWHPTPRSRLVTPLRGDVYPRPHSG
ncbi:MAG: DNA-processing protein DprA [Zetaproteobacteria bacterium]|nr:DNA-processing protein DprA [Zetaproteobacteria bacterium]